MANFNEKRRQLAQIETRHRDIGKKVAALSEMLATGSDADAVRAQLIGIGQIATEHFAEEEAFMSSVGFPRLPTHRMNHRWFTRFVTDYIEGLDTGTITINDDARRNLPNLVRFYLSSRDDDFETWLAARTARPVFSFWSSPVPAYSFA